MLGINNKKLLLLIALLFCNHKISAYVIVTTHQYTYSTPLSLSLVMGHLSTFLEESKYYKEEEVYFALKEFIRLRPINKMEFYSPAINYTLKYLRKQLTQKVNRIENQIKYQHFFDYKSLAKSAALLSIGTGFNGVAYYLYKKQPELIPFSISCATIGVLYSCLSLIDLPNALNPNRDNAYIEKYKKLLKFIKKLQIHKYQRDNIFWDLREIFI